MTSPLHISTRVLAGHRVEIMDPALQVGQSVDVYVVPRRPARVSRASILEFLDALPDGPRSAESWDEIERQFREERDSWDR